MALAQVKTVVYLQTDPGMYFIGRILRNLTEDTLRAPLPISAGEIDFRYFEVLNGSYADFVKDVPGQPFWISPDGNTRDVVPSVTSFLATGLGRAIFSAGGELLERLVEGADSLSHPSFRPSGLSNQEVVSEAKQFLEYAKTSGRRGTPHNL
jgi:hypothetical protein